MPKCGGTIICYEVWLDSDNQVQTKYVGNRARTDVRRERDFASGFEDLMNRETIVVANPVMADFVKAFKKEKKLS